jgi:hypothetical protein
MRARRADGPPWRDAELVMQSVGWLTAEELTELGAAVRELLARHIARISDHNLRPPGARLVRFVAWGVPDVDVPPTPDAP